MKCLICNTETTRKWKASALCKNCHNAAISMLPQMRDMMNASGRMAEKITIKHAIAQLQKGRESLVKGLNAKKVSKS